MRYFKELSHQEQEIVLGNLQDLPLFEEFRRDARNLLEGSKVHMFDGSLNLHTLSKPSGE